MYLGYVPYVVWYRHTMEYYSAIFLKVQLIDTCNNLVESQMHYAKWKKLDSNVTYSMIQFLWLYGKGKTTEIKHRPATASLEEWVENWTTWGNMRDSRGDGTVLYSDCGGGFWSVCNCQSS